MRVRLRTFSVLVVRLLDGVGGVRIIVGRGVSRALGSVRRLKGMGDGLLDRVELEVAFGGGGSSGGGWKSCSILFVYILGWNFGLGGLENWMGV